MHLLHLSLKSATAITSAVHGNFSSSKAQEIAISRGNVIEILRPDDHGKLHVVIRQEVFGVIRSIIPFRLTGGTKDYIVIGSDSGKISILEYIPATKQFEVRHAETFGKTGCRRITPGQYLAVDPKGRAIMIGAIEKQKLVYVMNRDASNRLTISSPLEAHRSQSIHFDLVGVDVGFENPIFAALEVDYSDSDSDSNPAVTSDKPAEKNLVYYELDLGLNHVIRRWSSEVPTSSHRIIPVPGGTDGPGGVLVCCDTAVIYKNENHEDVLCALPQRNGCPKASLIVASATHKQRDLFFMLIQNEFGDIFKVSLSYHDDKSHVSSISIRLFDTLPVASALCITRAGFLFLSSEFSNHFFFQFKSLGDEDNNPVEAISGVDPNAAPVTFDIRPLTNLIRIDEMESLSPILDMKIGDLANEETPQIYALCGRSERSSIRILRHGLAVTEMAVSELPGHPSAIWCVKGEINDEYDKYIIVSFPNATLVLSIGETVEEVVDSGFLSDTPTLHAGLFKDGSMVQIFANGLRHLSQGKPVTEWKAPGKKTIEKCAANSTQVVLSLSGGEIVYFELEFPYGSESSGQLIVKTKTDLGFEISCVELGEVASGRQRFPFLAIGGWDNTVRILSLDPNDLLKQRSTQALSSSAESLCIVERNAPNGNGEVLSDSNNNIHGSDSNLLTSGGLYLNIGLKNGVLLSSEIDRITGTLSNSQSRFLGTKGVQLFRLKIQGERSLLALSSRTWLSYTFQSSQNLTPLCYETLQYASSFCSEQCSDGIVAITGNTLRILALERLSETFNQQSLQLQYTPRRFTYHQSSGKLIIIESDHNAYSVSKLKSFSEDKGASAEIDDEEPLQLKQFVVSQSKSWGSCIRVYDPISHSTIGNVVELEENEIAVSIATCLFHDRGGEMFILIGAVKSLELHAKSANFQEASCYVYRLIEGKQLALVHKTLLDEIPYAICPFQGRVLIGLGKALRIYDLGKRKLLRKCENKTFPTRILKISTAGDRIYCADMNESFHFLKYNRADNQLVLFADDSIPRYVTSQVLLDYDTVAGGDKFGNLFVCRLPSEVSDEVDNPTGNRMLWDAGILNGAPNKLEQIAQFHVGEVITSVLKTTLISGGLEGLVYSTVMGSIGALVPFSSREDIDFYTHLEMYMRQENPPICGRDHLSYRSYYIPTKNITDGDLCEQYLRLPYEKQKSIANDMDRTPAEIRKKLADIRNRLL